MKAPLELNPDDYKEINTNNIASYEDAYDMVTRLIPGASDEAYDTIVKGGILAGWNINDFATKAADYYNYATGVANGNIISSSIESANYFTTGIASGTDAVADKLIDTSMQFGANITTAATRFTGTIVGPLREALGLSPIGSGRGSSGGGDGTTGGGSKREVVMSISQIFKDEKPNATFYKFRAQSNLGSNSSWFTYTDLEKARKSRDAKLGLVGQNWMFERGGLVNSPTVGMIGERGPEMILPLTGPHRDKGLSLLNLAIPKYFPELMNQSGGLFGGSSYSRVTNYNSSKGDDYNVTGPVTVMTQDPIDFANKLKEQYRVSSR
jgi:hypothetical protein